MAKLWIPGLPANRRRPPQLPGVRCLFPDARVLSRPVLLVAGILCIAMALRAPVTGVAPLIGMIRAQLGLSSTAAGMLITLPLLAFAAGSLAAAGLAPATVWSARCSARCC